MRYDYIYNRLIGKGLRENHNIDTYYEKHHIVPVCMGGTDDSYNLVNLTPEQHYVAHQLLVKIFPCTNSLKAAAVCMGATRNNNKVYGWLRRQYAESLKGIPLTKETKKKLSESLKEHWKIHQHPTKGRKLTKEHIEAIRSANTGRKFSDETKLKMSKSLLGNTNCLGKTHYQPSSANRIPGSGIYSQKLKTGETRWKASISIRNKGNKHLGLFETYEQALIARKEAEKKYWNDNDN